MNADVEPSSDEFHLCGAPTRLLGALHDESDHHWHQQFEIARELAGYGVTLQSYVPGQGDGRRLIVACEDSRLRRVTQLVADLQFERCAEKDCRDALQDVLIKAGRAKLGNASKQRKAGQNIDVVATAWVSWATKGGFVEEEFAAKVAQRNGGTVDASPKTIRRYLKKIRDPIAATVKSLVATGLPTEAVVVEAYRTLQGQRGVSEATVRLVVASVRR